MGKLSINRPTSHRMPVRGAEFPILVNTKEAAELLRRPPETLKRWDTKGSALIGS